MDLVTLVVGLLLGWLVGRVTAAPPAAAPPDGEADQVPSNQGEPVVAAIDAAPEQEHEPDPEPAPPVPEDVYAIARGLAPLCDNANHGRELEQHPDFPRLVALLASAKYTTQERLDLVPSMTTALSCGAIAALMAAGDDRRLDVARTVSRFGYMALHFALKYLAATDDPHVAGAVLTRAKPWWAEHPPTRAGLHAFLDAQKARGVVPVLDPAAEAVDVEDHADTLRALGHPLATAFVAVLERDARTRRGSRELASMGRVLGADDADGNVVAETPQWRAARDALVAALARAGKPSVVVVAPTGAGKSVLIRSALRELIARGYRVFESTPSQLMAGQKYIGEIDQRIENLVRGLGEGRAIWYIPETHALLEKGSWSGDPHGLLDLLLPYLEDRRIQILGESRPEAWARVLTSRPRAASLLPGIGIEAPDDAGTRALARAWADAWGAKLGATVLDAGALDESLDLARLHFPEAVEPGRSIGLLAAALEDARASDPAQLPLTRDAILRALSKRSGLPLEVLDVERPLDLDAVRRFFTARVIGQDEAVTCLVDRVGMLKAGLTDPRRPIGVFLFAGPTGTGKTEIAKALAEYLFGSADRMLRIDMSEYQADEAYWRLIDDGMQGRTASLATRIRQTPFSVVLLDEFEKASPRIWDLFLQVFDDGRLTDRAGNTASFRHSIIILTSNLGAGSGRSGGPGFLTQQSSYSRSEVERAIQTTFRREFVNRLDRVVIFDPLTRAVMRDILHKELARVLERRGFAIRDWAVEWEASAVEFLLEKGFTPDLGARPLRRAIDQYLLAPLARTIVEHKAPRGEQFLFITSDGRSLGVRFVDPDAPVGAEAPPAVPLDGVDLKALALDPYVDAGVLALLAAETERLAARTRSDGWIARKQQAADTMQQPDFWQRPERSAVLDRLERMDRIESGIDAARSLHGRLARGKGRGASDLVRRLALQIGLMTRAADAIDADEPEDAWLELKPVETNSVAALAWRDRLHAMYLAWAEARGLRLQAAGTDRGNAIRLHASGFGAWSILRDEAGLHVLESAGGDGAARYSVRVRSASAPFAPGAAAAADTDLRIRRRYTDGPSPLVRDALGGWRSGRLDRVLGGDFDLFAPAAE